MVEITGALFTVFWLYIMGWFIYLIKTNRPFSKRFKWLAAISPLLMTTWSGSVAWIFPSAIMAYILIRVEKRREKSDQQ